MKRKKKLAVKARRFFRILGPGLITGSSDDDPSGIATYSQAGASFGTMTLWTSIVTFPLMASIQEMCARIGLVTSSGLAGTLKRHYSKPFLYLMLLFSFPAIVLNIGADIAGMGAVSNLIYPAIPAIFYSIGFTILLLISIIYLPYQRFAAVLKYLCLFLLLYLVVPFLYEQDWLKILKNTFIPTLEFNKEFISIIVAILGTTISPYLFFWQATMEAEEVKHMKKHIVVNNKIVRQINADVDFGILFSNLVFYFIILTTGTVLFNAGIHKIDTVEQAAKALEPLAGQAAYLLFAIGIIGTGFLAIPVLSGSLAYIITETFGWQEGMDKKFHEAKAFYLVISISLILGLLINYIGISPIQALIYTAILYGVTAPVMIAIILHIANNKKIMGKFTNSKLSNVIGFVALIIMLAASGTLLYFQFN